MIVRSNRIADDRLNELFVHDVAREFVPIVLEVGLEGDSAHN